MIRNAATLVFIFALMPGVLHAQALSTLQTEFADALQRVERSQPERPDSAALQRYILFPYLQAQRLRQALKLDAAGSDAAVAQFLQQYDDAPWTRELRREWLGSLAGRQLWTPFLAAYRDNRADASLRCHRLGALIAGSAPPAGAAPDASLAALITEQWLAAGELPASCTAPVQWLKAQGGLTPELVERRARLALQAGNAGVAGMLAKQLPPERAAPIQQWVRLLADPRKELGALAQPAAIEAEALAAGFKKLARNDPDTAATILPRLEVLCGSPCGLQTPATIAELRRELALGHAWSRRPAAVLEFRQVPEPLVDERAQEWRIRAALWAGDWPQALAWVQRLPAPLAQQPRWRYWLGRTLAANDRAAEAQPVFETLLKENSFFSAAAAERLGRGYTPNPKAAPPAEAAALKQLAAQPAAQRARELFLVGRGSWAAVEWAEATRDFDAPRLVQAAHLASNWNWHLQAVATSSRAQQFDDFALLYPRPYEPEVQDGAKLAQLPAEWIYAVLRQESLYDPRARSSANALGLLQLLPETARAVAKRWSLPRPGVDELFHPQTNVRLGAAHLRELDDKFGGRFILALAAYNAGPNAMRRWLPPQPMDADVWIENIPFNETRNYIQRVLWHSVVFGWERSDQPQRLSGALQPVGPLP